MICNGLERLRSVARAMLRVIGLSAEIVRGALQASLSPQRGEGLRVRGGAAQSIHTRETSRHFPTPHPGPLPVEGRGRHYHARWLHRICRRVLRVFTVQSTVIGTVPTRGLLVANHLSYLDIVLLSALTPCVFAAKSEVKGWPVFGWFARMAGTIFVNRDNWRDAACANEAIRAALREGALVVLFPEGTSSDGSTVLPFKSSLLEAAIGDRVPISVAALCYELPDGDASDEACYWGEHTLVPHLIKLLSKRGVKASVAFSEVANTWRDRKKLAAQLHTKVSMLHGRLRSPNAAVLQASLSPQRGEGLRVRGGYACDASIIVAPSHILTPHPGPLPVEGRGRTSYSVRSHCDASLSLHVQTCS